MDGAKRTARGSPSLVNGAGLRTPSLRGSWVRIPPPAPKLASHCLMIRIDFHPTLLVNCSSNLTGPINISGFKQRSRIGSEDISCWFTVDTKLLSSLVRVSVFIHHEG